MGKRTINRQVASKSNEFKVSQSKMKVYKRCKQAYWYRYVEKLVRRRLKRPLTFGSMVHTMLEYDAERKDPFKPLRAMKFDSKKMFASEQQEYESIKWDVETIMTEYFAHWKTDPLRYMKINGKRSEHEFAITLEPGLIWVGMIDGIAISRDRLRWLLDHKTFKKAWNEDEMWRNLQSSTYLKACEILNFPQIDGICWNFIHSKTPPVPQILKSGGLSSRKINTLPLVVEETLKQHGLKLSDYRDLVESANHTRSQWFKRTRVPINKNVVDKLFIEFVDTAKRMRDNHGSEREMTIDRHCSWCDYETLCRARMLGNDEQYIRDKEYAIEEEGSHYKDDRVVQEAL